MCDVVWRVQWHHRPDHDFLLVFSTYFQYNVYRSKVIYAFPEVNNGGWLNSPLGACQTGSDVTSRQLDHGFLLVFSIHCRICLIWTIWKLFALLRFSVMADCRFQRLKGYLRPQVTLPVDIAIMVSYLCFQQHIFVYLVPFRQYRRFSFCWKWQHDDFGR